MCKETFDNIFEKIRLLEYNEKRHWEHLNIE